MRIKYIFSSRKSRRARDSPKMRKQKEKYPSMAEKIINDSDIILEVLDARFVQDTRNEELEKKAIKNKKYLIYVLNKSDLVRNLKNEFGTFDMFVKVSCKKRENIKRLRDMIKSLAKKISKEDRIVVGVIGYPNTGKSSLINLLIGKSSAGTGADAGFTKGIQKLKLGRDIVLLDTPGVIQKKDYSTSEKEKIAGHAITGGRSYSQIKDPEIAVAKLIDKYPGVLEKHYKLKSDNNSEILVDELGKKKNFLKKGGEVDADKTARFILKEWQRGEIKI
jgi:ribosome biogenesis GTPase A